MPDNGPYEGPKQVTSLIKAIRIVMFDSNTLSNNEICSCYTYVRRVIY